MKDLPAESARRRAIAWATTLAADTALASQQYEADLLECYARGELSLEQVLARLSTVPVHHVLYHSLAVRPLADGQLTDLLEQSQAWNEQHNITGLLVYCANGYFLQLLEGDAWDVHRLFSRILRDPRHQHVIVLNDAEGEVRRFPGWRMAFAPAEPAEFHWLIDCLDARRQQLVKTQVPINDPHILTLIEAFSQA